MDDIYFRVLSAMWRAIKRPFMFFAFKLGGYWFAVAYLVSDLFDIDPNSFLASFITFLTYIIFIYYVVRFFKRRKNPGWGILSSRKTVTTSKKERKILDPDIPEQLQHKEKTGVFFGAKNGKYVCQDEYTDGHTAVFGGSGSGKTSNIIMQTIKSWKKGPMFVVDIKGELEAIGLSAEKRKRTKIFNPEKEWQTAGYNVFFLAHTRKKQSQVLQDMNDIAFALIPDNTGKTKDPFWDNAARDILIGVLLYGFRVKKFGFVDTLEWLADHSSREVINEISECSDPDCRRQVKEFVDSPDNTLGSIWGSMMRPLKVFYQDEMIKNALRKEGSEVMTPRDLEDGWNLFCQIPEHKLEQWKSLLNLIISQHMRFFEQRSDNDGRLKPILLVLDEFPRLGQVSAIRNGLATLRSKKIRILLAAQEISQLRSIYGNEDTDTILANCSYKVCLGASSSNTQKYFSELAGKYDKTMVSRSTNQRDADPFGGSGTSLSEQQRNIIEPAEFGEIPNKEYYILFNPHNRFCRVNKLPWYKDKTWNEEEHQEGA